MHSYRVSEASLQVRNLLLTCEKMTLADRSRNKKIIMNRHNELALEAVDRPFVLMHKARPRHRRESGEPYRKGSILI